MSTPKFKPRNYKRGILMRDIGIALVVLTVVAMLVFNAWVVIVLLKYMGAI